MYPVFVDLQLSEARIFGHVTKRKKAVVPVWILGTDAIAERKESSCIDLLSAVTMVTGEPRVG